MKIATNRCIASYRRWFTLACIALAVLLGARVWAAVVPRGPGISTGNHHYSPPGTSHVFHSPPTRTPSPTSPTIRLSRIPLFFEPNLGQTAKPVQFLSHTRGGTFFLAPNELVLSLNGNQRGSGSTDQRANHQSTNTTIDHTAKPPSTISYPTHPSIRSSTHPSTPSVLRLKLAGANASAPVTGDEELAGKTNYFIGNDPKQWHTKIPN